VSPASLYDAAPCGLVTTALDGSIETVNATFETWTGYSANDLVGRNIAQLLEVGSRMFFETRHFPTLRLQGDVRAMALTLERADGSRLATLANSSLRDDRIHLAIFDATERTEYERELLAARRASEASEVRVRVLQSAAGAFGSSENEGELAAALASSVRAAFAATSTAVWIFDDAALPQLLAGSSPIDGIAAFFDETVTRIETVARAREISASLADEMEASRTASLSLYPLIAPQGLVGVVATFFSRERQMDVAYNDLHEALARQAAEVLVRVRLQQQLTHIALHDKLTGLANRDLLQYRLNEALARSVRSSETMAVFFLDLDGFKAVNDGYDHSTGDAVLVEAARRIVAVAHNSDVVARFGGDEFVVLCTDVVENGIDSMAAAMGAAIREPYALAPDAPVSASIGVAVYTPSPHNLVTSDELLNLADDAMYEAKGSGKNRAVIRAL